MSHINCTERAEYLARKSSWHRWFLTVAKINIFTVHAVGQFLLGWFIYLSSFQIRMESGISWFVVYAKACGYAWLVVYLSFR